MSRTKTQTHKQKQKDYFGIDQPHLNIGVTNYTFKLVDRVIASLGISKNDSVLEVGAGSGRFTLPLYERGVRVVASDFAPNLLEDLKKRNPSIPTLLGDIDNLKTLTNEKYDHIVGFFVLHHLQDIVTSLISMKEVLKKDGYIGFVEPNAFNPLYYVQPFISKNMSWEEEKGFRDMKESILRESLEKAGYTDIEFTRFGFFPPFIVNTNIGLKLDNSLERIPLLQGVLPFLLVVAKAI